MKLIIIKSVIFQWMLVLALFGISIVSLSQENLGRQTIVHFDPQNSVLRPDAHQLTESVPMEIGRKRPVFVNGVGGISFDKVALPENNLKIGSIKLNYNREAVNNSRLELMINDKPVKVHLPDWMLIPIAKYTESPYYSCVTLFGKLYDKTLEKQVTGQKGRVINYHPAFDNTLIGVRLAYMDMLLGYSFTSDLPRNSNGNYILGEGEVKPDVNANQTGAYNLSQSIISAQNKYKQTFRSYIISDYSRRISFKIERGSLIISGYPYYYCWKFNSDFPDYDINKVASELSLKYNQKMKELSKSSVSTASQDWLIDKMISLAGKYDGNFGFYSDGTFIDLVNTKTVAARKQFLVKYSPESLFDMIVKTEAFMNRDSVIYLNGFSDDVSSKPQLFGAANPAVWNATVNTMRFAAFFRYVKTNFPDTWVSFLNQIKKIEPEPRIYTPTIMYDPARLDLNKELINKRK
jgi:hypothetical protein